MPEGTPTHQERRATQKPHSSRREPEQCRRRGVYLYKYGMAAEPQSRKPCVVNGLRVRQKKFGEIEKKC